jgi:uncharacterized protein YbjT (DUF2867 family)
VILVTGATGLTGSLVIRQLSEQQVPSRALVRDPGRASALTTLPRVEIVAGDLGRPETLGKALAGVERAMLISSSDPAMAHVQCSFIDAAAGAGVSHVVKLSGIMPALDSPFRFARMHAQIEQHLAASGMAYTNLRAGEFMQAYFRQVPNIVTRQALLLPMAGQRIASIDAADIAAVAVRVLTEPGHGGQTYPITGPQALTMAEVARILSEVTGTPVRYIDTDPEVARQAQLAAGMPPYLADALAELFAERRAGKEAQVSQLTPGLLGRPPTTFAKFAARNAATFQGQQTTTIVS